MKRNNLFSMSRFWLLLNYDIRLNYKKYLLSILGAFLIGFLILYLNMPKSQYAHDFHPSNYASLFLVCLIGLAVFLGTSFPAFSSKTDSTNFIMLPCSTFEKYMSQILIRIVIGTALLFGIFYIDALLARSAALHMLSRFNNNAEIPIFHFSDLFYSFKKNDRLILYGMVLFFISAGTYLFSIRLFFNKLALVKTSLSLVALIFSIFLLIVVMSHLFHPETQGMNVTIHEYKVFRQLANVEVYFLTIISTPWLFLLPLGYFKLKEKQL